MSTCLVYNNGYSLKDHLQKRCFILLLVMASADWIHCDVKIEWRQIVFSMGTIKTGGINQWGGLGWRKHKYHKYHKLDEQFRDTKLVVEQIIRFTSCASLKFTTFGAIRRHEPQKTTVELVFFLQPMRSSSLAKTHEMILFRKQPLRSYQQPSSVCCCFHQDGLPPQIWWTHPVLVYAQHWLFSLLVNSLFFFMIK